MLIKITDIKMDAKLGTFDAIGLEGTRIDNGDEWGKRFFANNRKLADELAEFGVGDNCNVKMVQEGKHWNIAAFSEVSEAMIEKVKAGGGGYKNTPATGGEAKATYNSPAMGKASGDKMSKDEWATKNRKDKYGMSIHNSIAAASRLCKIGTAPDAVIDYAMKLVPFLLSEEPATAIDAADAGDPLDPPGLD
jgi:hypothetical protein